MGSMITLGIGKFEIDWGKNNFFTDHSALFLPSDVVQMPYYYANNVVEMKEGLARKLSSVKRRLDLLGYSPKTLARKYQEHLEMVPDYYPDVPISFEQFRSTVSSIDLEKVSLDAGFGDYDLGEFVSRYVFQDPEVRQHLPPDIEIDTDLGTFFENLDPYLTLRMLAENEKNADRLVQWRYADVVEVYCSPLRHEASELSIVGLTQQEVSHAQAQMGCEDQSLDCARRPKGQARRGNL